MISLNSPVKLAHSVINQIHCRDLWDARIGP